MTKFRIALSADFLRRDGSPAYPMFDLLPFTNDPDINIKYVVANDGVVPAKELEDVDALVLLAPRFTSESIPESGRLKIITRFGVGYNSVDLEACTRAGIVLTIAPDGVRRPVAASILTMLLALSTRLMIKDRLTRMGPQGWEQASSYMGVGLTGRTFGKLGIGNIGAEAIRLIAPLDMRFIAHDPYIDPAVAKELNVELVSMEELFRQADFLSISVPLNESTHGLVNARLLDLMKPTAFLINTARGPIVDQRALYNALVSKHIAGAGLDVFDTEPTPIDEPILKLDNVIVTPHALCFTDECFTELGASSVRNVLAVKRGQAPVHVVNPDALRHPKWEASLHTRVGATD